MTPDGNVPGRVAAGICLLVLGLGALTASAAALFRVVILPSEMARWQEHSFDDRTLYRLARVDGRQTVHAVCEGGSASSLIHQREIDLEETPIMEWSWRVDETLSDIDETVKAGDDYPARIYIVDEREVLRWRTRALNYVWANEEERGADWPNAYSSRAHMIAVRSGPPEEPGTWFTETRNVRRDFERYHDRDLSEVTHLAIMTDCDDAGQRTEAWYGMIRFLPDHTTVRSEPGT